MDKELKSKIYSYVIATVIALLMVVLVISQHDFSELSWADRYRYISDAFTVPGILYIMVYALVWASSQGALDSLRFLLKNVATSLIPGMRSKKPKSYGDYITALNENRKPAKRFLFLLVIGGILMVISIIFIFLFYQVYE